VEVLETQSTQPVEAETLVSDVVYVVREGNTLSTIAQAYGVTVDAIVEANDIQDPNAIYAGQELTIPDPALTPETVAVVVSVGESTESDTAEAVTAPALEWIEDTNPGPPFTIEVSANTAAQDPLVEASRTYQVTGVVRNDGDQTYAVSAINITFYDAEGFRGIFVPAIREGEIVGGEWLWHGQTEADFAALLLAPGEEWPFEIEIVAQDMASFLIHPDAVTTDRESVSVALSDVRLVDEGTGYLRISGTATNTSAFAAKNVTVSGVLIDGNGQIVSVGSAYVLEEDIAPGEAVGFDVRIEKEAYMSYQVYAQAERDWD
jgi:LysM repeat protein